MSCESNSNKASASATVAGGISKIQSKAAAVSTAAANRILNTIDRGGLVDKLASNPFIMAQRGMTYGVVRGIQSAAVGGLIGAGMAGTTPVMLATAGAVAAAGGVANYAVRLRADTSNGPVEEVPGPRGESVSVWPKKNDPSTVVFQSPDDGINWQKIVKTQGSQRITCLKANVLDPPEFYFKGVLSNTDAVNIATGQMKTRDIQKLPGYLGRIEKVEKLNPNWTMIKRAIIYQSAGGESGTPAHKAVHAASIGPRTSAVIFDAARDTGNKGLRLVKSVRKQNGVAPEAKG